MTSPKPQAISPELIPQSLVDEVVGIMHASSKARMEQLLDGTVTEETYEASARPSKSDEAKLIIEAVMRWRHS